ncbi:MAG: hypothetical protein Hyperionvirus22_1 [Hyperionvirus sp.]|uniref:Uncharacterized protein n=1 Tax=Hyperionvirus sp. TaxID=2487770 RepID=A0A3G5AAM0_9VIRU|nr:MAG: hypothetical protein Hyperionvirus22_1 [Hyperionvirus sp.]
MHDFIYCAASLRGFIEGLSLRATLRGFIEGIERVHREVKYLMNVVASHSKIEDSLI